VVVVEVVVVVVVVEYLLYNAIPGNQIFLKVWKSLVISFYNSMTLSLYPFIDVVYLNITTSPEKFDSLDF